MKRTKYFLLHDGLCVWRWKNHEMTFVDLRSFGKRNEKRRDTMDDETELTRIFKVKQISYKQARRIDSQFVN